VAVGAFSGTQEQADSLASNYHAQIREIDAAGVCGWVVDLRGNIGGNMWPMVAGLGPLAGTGILGYFVDPDSIVSTWTYGAGAAVLNDTIMARAATPYALRDPTTPVAVLTDRRTVSSGEAAAIAFRGRPATRSFGEATAGLSTANHGYALGDGAVLYLAVSTMADRTGRLYGGKVLPDSTVNPQTSAALLVGLDWLLQRTECRGG
jgi:C-terminal processing protease CtpA/Prc